MEQKLLRFKLQKKKVLLFVFSDWSLPFHRSTLDQWWENKGGEDDVASNSLKKSLIFGLKGSWHHQVQIENWTRWTWEELNGWRGRGRKGQLRATISWILIGNNWSFVWEGCEVGISVCFCLKHQNVLFSVAESNISYSWGAGSCFCNQWLRVRRWVTPVHTRRSLVLRDMQVLSVFEQNDKTNIFFLWGLFSIHMKNAFCTCSFELSEVLNSCANYLPSLPPEGH